jgi:hypothetical protein
MQTIELRAEKRELSSKGTLSKLRLEGQIPAVVYGGKKEPENLALNLKESYPPAERPRGQRPHEPETGRWGGDGAS